MRSKFRKKKGAGITSEKLMKMLPVEAVNIALLAYIKVTEKRLDNLKTSRNTAAKLHKLQKYQHNLFKLAGILDRENNPPPPNTKSWLNAVEGSPINNKINAMVEKIENALSPPAINNDAIELKKTGNHSANEDTDSESIEVPEINFPEFTISDAEVKQMVIPVGDEVTTLQNILDALDKEDDEELDLMISVDEEMEEDDKEILIKNYNDAKKLFMDNFTKLSTARDRDKAREIGRDVIDNLDSLYDALEAFEQSPYDFSAYQTDVNKQTMEVFVAHVEVLLRQQGIDINNLETDIEKKKETTALPPKEKEELYESEVEDSGIEDSVDEEASIPEMEPVPPAPADVIPPPPTAGSLDLSPKKEAKAKDHDAKLHEAKRLIKSIIGFKQIIDLERQLNPVSDEFTRTRENLAGLLKAAESVNNIKQELHLEDHELFENKDQDKYESKLAAIRSLAKRADKNLAELERRKQEAASMKATPKVTNKTAEPAKTKDSVHLTPASIPKIKPATLPPVATKTPDSTSVTTPAEAAKTTPTVTHKKAVKPVEKGIPYYTTFYRHETSKTENEAIRQAKAYLAEHGVKEIRQAVSLNVGNRLGFRSDECEYRSLLTKVASKKPFGKAEQVPVAIVQQIKPDKTYTRQDVLTGSGDIKHINRLPAGSKARNEKRMEQIQFAANLVETALAAIKHTGPIRAENWPTNLMNAAAVYCEQMGYDFHPKSVVQNMSAREKSSYESAFKALNETAEFKAFLKIAEERQAIKQEHASAPRPGKS